MSFFKYRSSRSVWLVAWALTLTLHGLTYVGFRTFRPFTPTPVQARNPDPIELVFAETAPPASAPEEPTFFTELPPDREDAAPEKADFLSNVTSRARDQVPGGDSSLPRMQGEGDAPMVALDPTGEPAPPVATPPPPEETPKADAADPTESQAQLQTQGQSPTPDPSAASPIVRDPDAARRAREASLRQLMQPRGGSDIHQPEMAYTDGNASPTGDVSLNTTAWNWAPWLQRFQRNLMAHWFAPAAYYMGILKEGGWAMVEVEVAPSGEMIRLDLLEEQGHPSLIRAATSALESVAPMEPLPGDFPEKTLVLRIRMVYPKVRSR